MIVDRYYYGKLPGEEKEIYRKLYQGCMHHVDVIPVPASKEMEKSYLRIVKALVDDNPLMYFVNQSLFELALDSNGNAAVLPQYFFSAEKVKTYNQRIQDAVNRIIAQLKLTEGSDLDKVRKVHDYLCENISYDHDGSDLNDASRMITAHNITGVFAHKRAQCEGIAKAAKVLLNAVDVPCMLVFGQAEDASGKMADHCWNIAKIDGVPYHIDITFDIGAGTKDAIAYDYYNVTDAQIRKDHIFAGGFPKCRETSANYFEQEGLIFTSKRKTKNYIAGQIKKGAGMVYFRLGGKLKVHEVCDEFFDYAQSVYADSEGTALTVTQIMNRAANTLRLTFT